MTNSDAGLRRAERLLACFQQALGHEMPNRLVALQGLAQILVQEEKRSLGPAIQATLERLSQLTQDLHTLVAALTEVGRTYRKIEKPEDLEIEDVWREAATAVKWQHPRWSIQFDISRPLPRVVLSREALYRVFLELILFAVRKCPPDYPLKLEVAGQPVADRTVEVWIHENGHPLSPQQQTQFFEPFAVLPGESGPVFGPFLAQLLLEKWGGTVLVESRETGGNVFRLRIPLAIGLQ